jgi:MSHA biogenesis protein MshP
MALIAALFMIIVVAALGVFALRIGANEQQTANLELLTFRAAAAAESGLEYGSNRAFNGSCAANTALAVSNIAVTVVCNPPTTHVINGVTYSVYTLRATAVAGVYGTPDFVQRTLTRRVTNIPPGVW